MCDFCGISHMNIRPLALLLRNVFSGCFGWQLIQRQRCNLGLSEYGQCNWMFGQTDEDDIMLDANSDGQRSAKRGVRIRQNPGVSPKSCQSFVHSFSDVMLHRSHKWKGPTQMFLLHVSPFPCVSKTTHTCYILTHVLGQGCHLFLCLPWVGRHSVMQVII